MREGKTSKIIVSILKAVPIILILTGCFLIHTQQAILVEGNVSCSAEEHRNEYIVKDMGNGSIALSVPRSVTEYIDISLTSDQDHIDLYPAILGMHFRHSAVNGKQTEGQSDYSYTVSKKYIRTNIFVLREYERLFLILAGIALALYLFFLLDLNTKKTGGFAGFIKGLFVALLAFLAVGLNDGFYYLQKSFQYISVNELLFHFNTNLGGANLETFKGLVREIGTHFAIVLAVLLVLWIIRHYKAAKKFNETHHVLNTFAYWICVAAGLLICIYPVLKFYTYFNVFDYLAARKVPSEIFEKYYVDPFTAEVSFPEKKKNLIYIYLESMEITASDTEHGGIEPVDTIPELTRLALDNTAFNGSETVLNGGVPLLGSTWTIGAMVAQSTGLPLSGPALTNQEGMLTNFMPGATAIGEILEDAGYKNVLLLGSEAEFGNRDSFFSQHGNYDICDYNWAIETGLIPADYKVWWGYEDKKLFQYAKDKAEELASGSQPFNLTLLTADTHYVDGYTCDLCGHEFEKKYANVINCSNNQVAEFVRWIQEQEWGKDTVIVLSGDHLYMESEYFAHKPSDYQRKTYVTYINAEKEEPEKWVDFCTMDLFPTTLSALGCDIPGGRLALGTDLYSGVPSLMEELGKGEFNEELGLYSKFYEESIMLGR